VYIRPVFLNLKTQKTHYIWIGCWVGFWVFRFLGFAFGLGEKKQNPTQKLKKIGVPVTVDNFDQNPKSGLKWI